MKSDLRVDKGVKDQTNQGGSTKKKDRKRDVTLSVAKGKRVK